MKIYSEINPFFEAICYLSTRFAKKRTGQLVKEYLSANHNMPKNFYSLCDAIIQLENNLDASFPVTDQIKYYFTPLKTFENNPVFSKSYGTMLLGIYGSIEKPMGFDNLIDYYESSTQEDVLTQLYDSGLYAFSGNQEKAVKGLNDFLSIIDSAFSDPKEKWDLVNIITDPVSHLNNMRPLIDPIADYIALQSGELLSFINDFELFFSSSFEFEKQCIDLGFELTQQEIENTLIQPSIFLFNGFTLFSCEKEYIRAFFGLAVPEAVSSAGNSSLDAHLAMLKALSDELRLKSLYYMRNNYSFGQELADKYGSSRNSMYYHLEKLMSVGLIQCKSTDYRMLYTMNKENVYNKLTALRDFLVDGWTPEKH